MKILWSALLHRATIKSHPKRIWANVKFEVDETQAGFRPTSLNTQAAALYVLCRFRKSLRHCLTQKSLEDVGR